jgi:uncharacterized membrane protein (DUF4010 family)
MELTLPFKLLISLALGAAIGLEREVHEKHDGSKESAKIAFIGVRTLSLITALGTIAGLLYSTHFSLFLIITITFMTLLMIHYIFTCFLTKDIGITTEIAIICSYLIGNLIALEVFPMQIIIAITVILILILANKDRIKDVIQDIKRREIRAFIAYGIIALVILPFLPNTSLSLNDIPHFTEFFKSFDLEMGKWGEIEIINPFKLWLIVALITGIDLAGYVMEQTIGKNKGLLITSLVGGFISSTATTQALAQQSKETNQINQLVAFAIFATLVSFFSVFIVLASVNSEFIVAGLPTFIILILSCLGTGMYFYLRKHRAIHDQSLETPQEEQKDLKIFALEPALKFAFLYLLVRLVTKISLELFGSSGFLITSALAGFTGIDAASINIADLAGKGITYQTAVLAFIIVNAVNLIAKTFYSYLQAKREFTIKYAISMGIVIVVSFFGLLFVPNV